MKMFYTIVIESEVKQFFWDKITFSLWNSQWTWRTMRNSGHYYGRHVTHITHWAILWHVIISYRQWVVTRPWCYGYTKSSTRVAVHDGSLHRNTSRKTVRQFLACCLCQRAGGWSGRLCARENIFKTHSQSHEWAGIANIGFCIYFREFDFMDMGAIRLQQIHPFISEGLYSIR